MAKKEYDLIKLVEELVCTLKIKAAPTVLKRYDDEGALEKIEGLTRPRPGELHSFCQIMGMATRLNMTVGATWENILSSQCLHACAMANHEDYKDLTNFNGVWVESDEEALKHQHSLRYIEDQCEAIAVSPVVADAIEDPELVILYGSPQQIMFILNALQYKDFERSEATFVGETSCDDSWVRALIEKKPCWTIPCYGERRYGGVMDDELIICFPPEYIVKIIDGLHFLYGNGLKYPTPQYGINWDVRPGVGRVYDVTKLKPAKRVRNDK